MRVLVLTNTTKKYNGYGRVTNDALYCFDKSKIQFFTSEKRNKLRFKSDSMKSEFYNKYGIVSVVWDLIIIALNLKKKPDLIYIVAEHYALVGIILGKIINIPIVITLHGTYACKLPKLYFLYRVAFKQADRLVCVSNYTKKKLINIIGPSENINLVPLGINKSIFKPSISNKKSNQICFIGNHKKRKGFDVVCKAMEVLDSSVKDLSLICVGKFDMSSKKEAIKLFSLLKNIRIKFYNEVSENQLVNIYQSSKVNILPSVEHNENFEGFGYTHIEAICCGTFTIGSIRSGNQDAIHPSNGFLLNDCSGKELAKKLIKILQNDSYPVLDIEKVYSVKQMSNRYKKIFEEVLK